MSQSDAVGQATFMTKKQGVKFRAYKCPFCHLPNASVAWHVGHAQPLRRRLGR